MSKMDYIIRHHILLTMILHLQTFRKAVSVWNGLEIETVKAETYNPQWKWQTCYFSQLVHCALHLLSIDVLFRPLYLLLQLFNPSYALYFLSFASFTSLSIRRPLYWWMRRVIESTSEACIISVSAERKRKWFYWKILCGINFKVRFKYDSSVWLGFNNKEVS